MRPFVFLMMLAVAGCALRPESTSILSAVVRSYGELVPLGTPRAERAYYVAELVITAPPGLESRIVRVRSERPLPAAHLFRKTDAHLRLSIVSLESGQGTSLVPAEGITHISYDLKIESVKSVAEEPNSESSTNHSSQTAKFRHEN